MIGTYFTTRECEYLIPLLIRELDFLESSISHVSLSEKMRIMKERSLYREILGKILSSSEIGDFCPLS